MTRTARIAAQITRYTNLITVDQARALVACQNPALDNRTALSIDDGCARRIAGYRDQIAALKLLAKTHGLRKTDSRWTLSDTDTDAAIPFALGMVA